MEQELFLRKFGWIYLSCWCYLALQNFGLSIQNDLVKKQWSTSDGKWALFNKGHGHWTLHRNKKIPNEILICLLFLFVSERNYGSSIYAQQEALELGCQQVLWLYGEDHQITEVGTMNLFLYWINEDGGIVTHNMKTLRVDSWDHKAGIHILCTRLLEANWTPRMPAVIHFILVG